MSGLGFMEPPSPDDARGEHARHWTLDLPVGYSEADLAGSLVRELEAICSVEAGSVWIRRGEVEDDQPWWEITAEEVRQRDLPEW